MNRWKLLEQYAAPTRGLFAIGPACRACGIARRTVERRSAAEGWWAPFPGVRGLPGCPRDRLAWVLAATLSVGAPVAATRWTGAALLRVTPIISRPIQLVVPATRHPAPLPGVEITRSRTLLASDVALAQGVPTVTPDRLPFDLAGVCDLDRLRSLLIDMRQQRLLDVGAAMARLAAIGPITGRSILRQALYEVDASTCDSAFEWLMAERCEGEGILLDRGHVPVPVDGAVLQIDLGIRAILFGIECEGLGSHGTQAQLAKDQRRSNALALAGEGWLILRVGWQRFTTRWSEVAEEIRSGIRQQSLRHLGLPWPRVEHLRR